ncbi:MAG: DNA-primase RepB domain-containing protein, partial [Elusimicrobia bacterium]|nr:DNA-primase RepB domain-containing protein [Elusimicrobiota bacterium]
MTGISQVKIASKKAENLRNFLVGHANINGGKTVLFFFKKSNKKGDTMGPPVKVSFRNMSVERENYQYGHSVHAKNLTASFCEKIIQFSKELELNIFFTVPALLKNKRKHDDVMGIGCAYLDDIPGTILSDSLFSDGMIIEDFSFPASSVIQTSPGNCQVLWNFKGFLPIDNKYKGPQPSFLPSAPKHRKDLFNRMLRLLKTKLEGDPGGSNLNQLYRLPFTLNHKYSPAPEVELLYSDFSPENRINFGKFYTELLMPEIKKHYKEKFPGIFSKIHKNNDWILIENLLGWGESAEDIGRSWTANERDMSATGRLLNHY